ncbi:MAG: LytR C-terminal domain-containing protein [Clostridia bacterium]|nr:LytR C-terminal domain-containing protein [Clostridia bacterium]
MRKSITILLGISCAVLLFFNVFILISIDNEAPVIEVIDPEFIYVEGSDESELIKAVKATDSKDSDCSEFIKVEKTYVSQDKTTVKVDFVVKDTKNNVSKKHVVFGYAPDPNVKPEPEKTAYNVVLINNLGIENLANSYAKLLQENGHKIVSIGLSTDPPAASTAIYVAEDGMGEDLLKHFPGAQIYVGNIANRVNVDSKGADVFIILGYQNSTIPTA